MKTPQFEIFESRSVFGEHGGEFYFRLRARNGEVVLASEAYKSAAHARRGIAQVLRMLSKELPVVKSDE